MLKKLSFSLALLMVFAALGCSSGNNISIRDAERFISNCAAVVNTEEFSSESEKSSG